MISLFPSSGVASRIRSPSPGHFHACTLVATLKMRQRLNDQCFVVYRSRSLRIFRQFGVLSAIAAAAILHSAIQLQG